MPKSCYQPYQPKFVTVLQVCFLSKNELVYVLFYVYCCDVFCYVVCALYD
jgi:hypothetical protein